MITENRDVIILVRWLPRTGLGSPSGCSRAARGAVSGRPGHCRDGRSWVERRRSSVDLARISSLTRRPGFAVTDRRMLGAPLSFCDWFGAGCGAPPMAAPSCRWPVPMPEAYQGCPARRRLTVLDGRSTSLLNIGRAQSVICGAILARHASPRRRSPYSRGAPTERESLPIASSRSSTSSIAMSGRDHCTKSISTGHKGVDTAC